jgi:methyl-accepting chemotaxis protein
MRPCRIGLSSISSKRLALGPSAAPLRRGRFGAAEQGAATQEISRNVQQAVQGTQQVSSNITDVQRGASETGSASRQVLSAAQTVSGDRQHLSRK